MPGDGKIQINERLKTNWQWSLKRLPCIKPSWLHTVVKKGCLPSRFTSGKAKGEGISGNRCLAGAHKKGSGGPGGSRGRLISLPDRQNTVNLINQAVKDGARQSKACEALGLTERTVQRWSRADEVMADNRKNAKRPDPANKLSEAERQGIVDVSNSECFRSQPPSQIVPTLADEGVYLALRKNLLPDSP